MTTEEASIYRFGDIQVEPRAFRASKSGKPVALEPKAFEVLVFLIEHRERLVEKGELLDHVWKDTFVTENAMTRVVAHLRKALGDAAREPKYIETVPTRGYRFIAHVDIAVDNGEGNGSKGSDLRPEPTGSDARPSPPANVELKTASGRATEGSSGQELKNWSVPLLVAVLLVAAVLTWSLRNRSDLGIREQTGAVQVTYSPGLDTFPTFSPDGSSIAYSSDQSGSFEIYVRPLVRGGRAVPITADGQQNLQPAWSPDGKYLAYHSRLGSGIWLVPALGGTARRLADFGSSPAWSPDGQWIAFHSDTLNDLGLVAFGAVVPSTLWLTPLGSGPPRQITQSGNPVGGHGSPCWSPDGRQIVFVTHDLNAGEIWSFDVKSQALKQLGTRRRLILGPRFSPDGTLYFASELKAGTYAIWKLPRGASAPVEVIDTGSRLFKHLAISHDGRRIAYSAQTMTSNLWSVPIVPHTAQAAGDPLALTSDTSFRKTLPTFSPRGDKIAFSRATAGTGVDVWMMDSRGRNPVQVTADESGAGAPSWLPGGERIAFLSWQQKGFLLKSIDWMTSVESEMRQLEPVMGIYRLSPDGKLLAYHVQRDGAVNIWVAPAQGGAARQLTFDRELMGFPSWSPDSRWLSFEVKRGADTHVAVIPSSGGEPAQLTSEVGQSWPCGWSPDMDKIAFAGLRDGCWNVWWVSRSTRKQQQVTHFRRPNLYVRYPAWSPQGDQVVYEHAETVGNVWVMDLRSGS